MPLNVTPPNSIITTLKPKALKSNDQGHMSSMKLRELISKLI
jgi:hypothetical protein